jgi:hypothetical protein
VELKDMDRWIDPPSGWMYGFPKFLPRELHDATDDQLIDWLVSEGYPIRNESDRYLALNHSRTIFYERTNDPDDGVGPDGRERSSGLV